MYCMCLHDWEEERLMLRVYESGEGGEEPPSRPCLGKWEVSVNEYKPPGAAAAA